MAYKHEDRSSGQVVRSTDWNAMGRAIQDLDAAKLDRAGDTIKGDLTVAGKLSSPSARFTSSLDVTGPANLSGALSVGGNLTVTGPTNLSGALSVRGSLTVTGEIQAAGAIRAANSDIYFTNISHKHTGTGNTPGMAAIENSESHDGLMILGRAHSPGVRVVRLWDYLEINGNLDVTGNLQAKQKITSPQWQVNNIINNKPGPLPISAQFNSGGGTLLILAAGTGFFSEGPERVIGMNISLDNKAVGLARSYSNEKNSHKAFSSSFLVIRGIGAGAHTVSLTKRADDMSIDSNDFFNVTVLELPF